MAKTPSRQSSPGEIERFLQHSKNLAAFVDGQPRLLFAIDATASRQPTWDIACHLQGNMFRAAERVASLAVQLCYFRGFHDFSATSWLTDSSELARQMSRVQCEGGQTQIGRLLQHALAEHSKTPIRALVFIGDAMEENADKLCKLAGQCRLLKLPLFMFQEGQNRLVSQTFGELARISGGAFAHFDQHSADALAALLGAVARYAAGGRQALQRDHSKIAKQLLQQLP